MTAEPIRLYSGLRPLSALQAFVARYEAMTPAEQADEDERWYLAEDARCAAQVVSQRAEKTGHDNLIAWPDGRLEGEGY